MIGKITIANLLLPPLPGPETSPHHQTTHVRVGLAAIDQGDREYLSKFSNILLNVDEEATFDALYSNLPFAWQLEENYDTINPFGDIRDVNYNAIWTFDTQNDVLYHTNHDSRRKMSISVLRKQCDVSLASMELLGVPLPPPLEPKIHIESQYWKPQVSVPHRVQAFICRLLRDFRYQWRHILRNSYSSITLRVLAKAIIRLSTLDFQIRQNTEQDGLSGFHVRVEDLPAWEPFSADVVRVGKVWLILCQEIQEGLLIARQHVSSQTFGATTTDPSEEQAHYMVLSVRHIVLCHATGPDSLKHTAPEPLFNDAYGIGSPSHLALSYLLWATASARSPISTPIQLLPVEIQDIILNNVSIGTVQAAKVGCLLGVGSPFLWTDGSVKVILTELSYHRPRGSPVESHVWFGAHKSGIVYLAGKDRRCLWNH